MEACRASYSRVFLHSSTEVSLLWGHIVVIKSGPRKAEKDESFDSRPALFPHTCDGVGFEPSAMKKKRYSNACLEINPNVDRSLQIFCIKD